MIDWSKFKVRCSAISKVLANSKENAPLTDKQVIELADLDKRTTLTAVQATRRTELITKRENSKNVVLSDTCIAYLVEAYAWETQKMCSVTKEMDVEYFTRGRLTEPESIELLSFVDDTVYLKNEERFENQFLSGIPDVLEIGARHKIEEPDGFEIYWTKKIRDTKSCQDYPTFLYKIHKGVDPGNREQLQGYGDIMECEDLAVVFTLPTMPEVIREQYKWRLANKMQATTIESPEFLRAWSELERSMIFDSIPAHQRVYKIPVEPFTPSEKQALYDRVKHCREWLANFHERYLKINK